MERSGTFHFLMTKVSCIPRCSTHAPLLQPTQQTPRRPAHLLRASAAARQTVHFLALWASALGVERIGRGGVATAYTEEFLRSPGRGAERRAGRRTEHRPELAAQHAIRATHYLLRHSFPSPSLLVGDSSPTLAFARNAPDQQGRHGTVHEAASYGSNLCVGCHIRTTAAPKEMARW